MADKIEGFVLGNGAVISVCRECKKAFVDYSFKRFGHPAKTCPPCNDKLQQRPSIVIERECLHRFESVQIVSLPGAWSVVVNQSQPSQIDGLHFSEDAQAFKIDVSGGLYGASWAGRIVIYAAEEFTVGDVVNVRAMVARHKTKVITTSHTAIRGGTYTRSQEVSLQTTEGEETILERPYIALERSGEPAIARLVWAEAHTKTTIKGYGRQFWARFVGSPLFEWRISGGARSGRYHTIGALAILDADHPLEIIGTGDVAFETSL